MKCPGQDSRYWQPGAIFETTCPQCGCEVEFFKDESSRKCKRCGHKFVNPKMDFGCASYCKYAALCLGELTPEMLAKRDDLLKDRVAIEMKKHFKQDFRSIAHASKVARYAETIVKAERGDPAVVLSAAYLHDIGGKEAKSEQQGSAARVHQQEGPRIAREILERLGAREEMIAEVCDIIAHHHQARSDANTNFKAVYDAILLVNLEDTPEDLPTDAAQRETFREQALLTPTGRELAKNILKFSR
jgi:putative nucleotidyltransferase with HDIG domain